MEDEPFLFDETSSKATLMPVIHSELKFAAHGSKFLKNYICNLPHYVKRLNAVVNDDKEPVKKQQLYRGYLAQLSDSHIAVICGLYDVYACLANAQHGVCKVNQFP